MYLYYTFFAHEFKLHKNESVSTSKSFITNQFINSIFWLKFICKKLLKCNNATKFLRLNLNYEKAKNISLPLPYLILNKTTKDAKNITILLIFDELILSFYNFSSSVVHQSYALVRCHTIDINYWSILFYMLIVV